MAGLFDEQYPALPLAGAGPDRSGLFTEAFAGYQPPSPDYVGQVAARVRGLLGLLQPSQWQEQLGPAAWEALAPQLEQRAARAQAPGESPGYQEMMDLALNFGPGPMGLLGQIVHHGGPHNEMGRRLAKEQGLLPETIPDELPAWAPAERMAQWRTARANAALPVEQGGLGLGPANTAAERAKAGGFEGGWVHGTGSDFTEFSKDPAKVATITPTNTYDAQKAHFLTRNPEIGAEYAEEAAKQRRYMTFSEYYAAPEPVRQEVIKVLDKAGINNQYDFRIFMEKLHDDVPMTETGKKVAGLLGIDPARPSLMPLMARGEYAAKDYGGGPWKEWDTLDALRAAEEQGKAGLLMKNVGDSLSGGNVGDSLAVFNPANIRSRFAAFDPKRRTEADLLASWLLPLVLGAGAASYGLLGQPPVD